MSDADLYSRRAHEQRTIASADQAEFAAVVHQSAVVDAGVYDDRIADNLDDFDPGEARSFEGWHRRDLEIEGAVGEMHEEIQRRAEMLGKSYPFRLDGNQLRYKKSLSGFYEFCLAICNADNLTTGPMVQFPRAFERVTTVLLKRYFGETAEAQHTGWPRDDGAGTSFRDAMAVLNQRSGEWIWSPEAGLPEASGLGGDEGLDIVVWKRAPDTRLGHLFLLAQCACGNDWNTKFNDLDLARLQKWFKPLSFVSPPVRAFATPHQVSRGNFRDAQRRAGLIFDRTRLTLIADEMIGASEWTPWQPRLLGLAQLILSTRTDAHSGAK